MCSYLSIVIHFDSQMTTKIIILHTKYYITVGGVIIPRTKGSKNKKTLLKEKNVTEIRGRVEQTNDPVIIPEFHDYTPKQRVSVRLFTLEKTIHDSFMKDLSHYENPKLYESYIVNEMMTGIVNKKIKLPTPDAERLRDYMSGYGKVGFEDDKVDEFKAANRLVHKTVNSFIQYQYPIIVDIDIKASLQGSPSYIINECLKLYNIGEIKIDISDFKIKEWELMYKYALKKSLKDEN